MNLKDIGEQIKALISTERVTDPYWLTNEIMSMHELPRDMDQADFDFYTITAHDSIRKLVAQVVRGYRRLEDFEEGLFDLVDPDWRRRYKHLQKVYAIKRAGRFLIVPLHLITDEEFESKISEMEVHRLGLSIHVDEIRRYMTERRSFTTP